MAEVPDLMVNARGASSDRQDKSARNKFNEFLGPLGYQDITKLRKRDVTTALMGSFATFLLTDKIGYQTSMNYLSSVKTQLEKITKTELFKRDPNWYASLRLKLDKEYKILSRRTGEKLKNPAPAMTPADLLAISKQLFKMTHQMAAADRLLINQQWLSLGRSSDVACLRFDDLAWMGKYVLVDLTRLKIRSEQKISIFCSPGEWATDPFHALGCLLLCDKYKASDTIFSHLGADDANVSAYINRLLKTVSSSLEEAQRGSLTPKLQSHSARRGSATVAASNPHVNLAEVGYRGLWKLDGYSSVFEYVASTTANDQKVGKVLGGWNDPTHGGIPPSMYAIIEVGSSSLKARATRFCAVVYDQYFSKIRHDKFKEVLLASVLMYLDETIPFCIENKVHRQLLNIGKRILVLFLIF